AWAGLRSAATGRVPAPSSCPYWYASGGRRPTRRPDGESRRGAPSRATSPGLWHRLLRLPGGGGVRVWHLMSRGTRTHGRGGGRGRALEVALLLRRTCSECFLATRLTTALKTTFPF